MKSPLHNWTVVLKNVNMKSEIKCWKTWMLTKKKSQFVFFTAKIKSFQSFHKPMILIVNTFSSWPNHCSVKPNLFRKCKKKQSIPLCFRSRWSSFFYISFLVIFISSPLCLTLPLFWFCPPHSIKKRKKNLTLSLFAFQIITEHSFQHLSSNDLTDRE